MRFAILFLLSLLSFSCFAQLRYSTLQLKAKEVFQIKESDIVVVDTLIMEDSSSIVLNHDKKENFIHAKKIMIGKGCRIDGRGANGTPGKAGLKGNTGEGPCRDGQVGKNGTGGSYGDNGVNLYLYCSDFIIKGNIEIDLSGGNGGDGGKGGEGGGGSPGTRVCVGGNGGNGGNGSTGGNGGDAGTLTISCKNCTDLRSLLNQVISVNNFGGVGGLGGDAGPGGSAGLNPTGNTIQDGKLGAKGKSGLPGQSGKKGAINFMPN